jgi:Glycerophosphoryl diester phosphodiesterase family
LGAAFMFLSTHHNKFWLVFALWSVNGYSQEIHPNAHAHNDYEHTHPLWEAFKNGFMSVEADVHLRGDLLLVAHNFASKNSPSLEQLYLKPLDSLMMVNNGCVYPYSAKPDRPFYLMIDVKTDAEKTFNAIKKLLESYPTFKNRTVIRIFLSGNRDNDQLMNQKVFNIGMDGRPDDLGKGYSSELMPVISDHFKNWSGWSGKTDPDEKDIREIKALAIRVHAEKKLLRLWAIPDNELVWGTLLNAGVDLINTDHLVELNKFLTAKGY